MNNSAQFRLNTPHVASEVIDGEAILIHFDKGCYYSTDGEGASIISAIAEGFPLSTIQANLESKSKASTEIVASVLDGFLSRLVAEGIICHVNGEESEPVDACENSNCSPSADSLGFAIPILEKFTDLEDLLLLDPIHDVDAAGWPMAEGNATAPNSISNTGS